MKFIIVVSSLLAVATAWESIQEKYHGPLHYPKIHKGVPVEPAAVQHAREAHLIALSQASAAHGYSQHNSNENYYGDEQKKWVGPKHYPVIYNGVPVEPAEVQHAREAHLEALSQASHSNNNFDQYRGYENNQHEYGYQYNGNYEEGRKWNGPLHYPKINKGVPVEPVEVQHARVAHFKALSEIKYNGGVYGYSSGHNAHQVYEHDGKPMDTHEVEVAKSKHFAAVKEALARNAKSKYYY